MKPIGLLMREHRLIEQMLEVVGKNLSEIISGAEPDFCDIQKIGDFFRFYADRIHHGKEEEILFHALAERELTEEHRSKMSELVDEHRLARGIINRLVQSGDGNGKSMSKRTRELTECFKELLMLYPKHIAKEDKTFFYPILEYFSDDEMDKMLEDFWDFDKQMIHKKYTNLVDELG